MKQAIVDFLQAQKTITDILKNDNEFLIRKVNMDKSVFYSSQTYDTDLRRDYRVPEVFKTLTETVTRIYQKNRQGSSLIWVYNEGFCQLSYTVNNKSYILNCTTIQAIILFFLNEQGEMSLQSISELTKFDVRLIMAHIFALYSSHIVEKPDKATKLTFNPSLVARINATYSNPSTHIVIRENKSKVKIINTEDQDALKVRDVQ